MGFTLIEIAITILIIGIIATIALPSYLEQIRENRRYDATATLLNIILAQEQFRMKNNSYGTLADVWNCTQTPDKYYNLTLTSNTATGYTLTATSTVSGGQANDTADGVNCGTLSVVVSGLNTSKNPTSCW